MKKEVKLIEVVRMLQSQGHDVSYYIRKDGSIRITKIDQLRYTGSAGNIQARSLAGVTISERREKQLGTIRTKPGHWGNKPTSKLSPDLVKRIRRAQRLWRKNKVDAEGYPSTKNVRYIIKEYGEEEAIRRLNESEKYARGIAYTENVNWIIKRLEDDLNKAYEVGDVAYLQEAIDILKRNIDNFQEAHVSKIHEVIYSYEIGHEKTSRVIVSRLNELGYK